jgi:hypothetical protein
MSHIHNNKQNKVGLRDEGVDLDKLDTEDEILYVPMNGETYLPYSRGVFDQIKHGSLRL